MLERVPAAAESTAHIFLRSIEQPVRSSRVLDSRFWRNGADHIESSPSSSWWPAYLQQIRTVPQVRSSSHDDNLCLSIPPSSQTSNSNSFRKRRDALQYLPVKLHTQHKVNTSRLYSVTTPSRQSVGVKEKDTPTEFIENKNYETLPKSGDGSEKRTDHTRKTRASHKKPERQSGSPQLQHGSIVSASFSRLDIGPIRSQYKPLSQKSDGGLDRLDQEASATAKAHSVDTSKTRSPTSVEHSTLFPASRAVPPEVFVTNSQQTGTRRADTRDKNHTRISNGGVRSSHQTLTSESEAKTPGHKKGRELDSTPKRAYRNREDPRKILPQVVHTPFVQSPADASGNDHVASEPNVNLASGWHLSNPFAALVPEEQHELTIPEPPSPPYEQSFDRLNTFGPMVKPLTKPSVQPARKEEVRTRPKQVLETKVRDPSPNRSEQRRIPISTYETILHLDSKAARLDELLRVRATTTPEQVNEVWSLFLSMNDQEAIAPNVFEFLAHHTQYSTRALAAYNIIPRPKRTSAIYRSAMHIELQRYQYDNAMKLAFEANIRGFNILPELFVYLVDKLMWNSVAELMHRNKDARREFAAFASALEAGHQTQTQMLPLRDLIRDCQSLPDLPVKIISLIERVRSQDLMTAEHQDDLQWLSGQLAIQAVQSSDVIAAVTPQALLAILDLEETSRHLRLHARALHTIFDTPHGSDRLDLAMMIFRNLRFRCPFEKPSTQVFNGLISLCNESLNASTQLYDYILKQYGRKPSQRAYHGIMNSFAQRGDIGAVKKYLKALIKTHGRPTLTLLVNPLIYAYAVVGDVLNAREELDQLETSYGCKADTVSWNMLMLAHVRSEDDESAFQILHEMRNQHIKPNQYTYGQLLAVCASRGDIEFALDLLADARHDEIEITVPMINTIVETYLQMHNVPAALRFAAAAPKSGKKQELTRLWNSFVRYFAFNGQMTDLMNIRKTMAQHNIAADGMTYAAMMALLTSSKQTSAAMKLLRQMRQTEKLPVTMFHYSMILHGYVAEMNRDMATLILNEMKQKFPDSDAVTSAAFMSLQTLQHARVATEGEYSDSASVVARLAELLKDVISDEGRSFHGTFLRKQDNIRMLTTYLEIVIRALLRSGSHDLAAHLVDHVHKLRPTTSNGLHNSVSSKGMSLVQLDLAMEREDWAEFERLWNAVFESTLKAKKTLTESKKAYRTEQSAVLARITVSPSARFSLGSLLNRYMEAMARQDRQRDMQAFLRNRVWASGFEFTGRNWNKYIQVLCRSRERKDRVRAFASFERNLRTRAQSWKLLIRGNMRKKVTSYEWKPYGQRHRPILQRRNVYRVVPRTEELRLRPHRKIPTYTTMVHLSDALRRAQLGVPTGHRRVFELIKIVAPRTKKFVEYMPHSRDAVQGSILRQGTKQEEPKRRPRSEESLRPKEAFDGLIYDQSPLEGVPLEYLNDIEEITGQVSNVKRSFRDSKAGDGHFHDKLTDLELGEMFAGQVSRVPVILAAKGRLETVTEMGWRIDREERNRRDIAQRVRADIRARSTAQDAYRPSLQATQLSDLDQSLDMQGAHSVAPMSSPASTSGEAKLDDRSAAALATGLLTSNTAIASAEVKPDGREHPASVSQQLAELAQIQEQRTRQVKERRSRARRIPKLALDYVHSRRLRRRLALAQRRRAGQLQRTYKQHLSHKAFQGRTLAKKRLEAFWQAKRRRIALFAYEHDLKSGKRLDPFPKTLRGVRRRRLLHGMVRLRFVADLGRKGKNYGVRRGELYDNRQRRKQTSPSKGINVVRGKTKQA